MVGASFKTQFENEMLERLAAPTVDGGSAIGRRVRRARKSHRCFMGEGWASPCQGHIRPGDLYTECKVPPGGELGYLGWTTWRACSGCSAVGRG